jgi:hypothetical protein
MKNPAIPPARTGDSSNNRLELRAPITGSAESGSDSESVGDMPFSSDGAPIEIRVKGGAENGGWRRILQSIATSPVTTNKLKRL